MSIKLIWCWTEDLGSGVSAEVDAGGGGSRTPVGGQWKVMAADWMVMPRARSTGRKSVTVEPSSTSVSR